MPIKEIFPRMPKEYKYERKREKVPSDVQGWLQALIRLAESKRDSRIALLAKYALTMYDAKVIAQSLSERGGLFATEVERDLLEFMKIQLEYALEYINNILQKIDR